MSLSSTSYWISEEDGEANVSLDLTGLSNKQISVTLITQDGTAIGILTVHNTHTLFYIAIDQQY